MNRDEQEIHKTTIQHLKVRGARGIVYWHTPNGAFLGGKRSRKGISIQGSIFKGLGVRKGVSDIIAVHASKVYALELKAPGGVTSEEQDKFMEDMAAQGAFTAVAEGLDAAIAQLEAWGLLIGRAS
jgi:VRR-NUC domain